MSDPVLSQLIVEESKGQWYLCWPDGSFYAGPYKTVAAAKTERTKIRTLM